MRLIILFVLLLVFFVLDILLGSVLLPLSDVLQTFLGHAPDEVTREIVLNYRLPKAITAILTGAALSVGGVLMQVLFRNPLAGPDVLGINSGAGLGVALFTMFGFSTVPLIGEFGLVGVAISGAFAVLLCVIAVSHRIKENTSLLIIGIMIGNLAGAAVSILQSISNPDAIKLFIIWTFGSLSSVSPNQMLFMFPLVVCGLIIAFLLQKDLNTLLLGDNYARSLGVNVPRVRLWIILSTALLAG
ncbi:MAG: FecCD family ABC transporter permease, partial [Bacteroidales bacterium]